MTKKVINLSDYPRKPVLWLPDHLSPECRVYDYSKMFRCRQDERRRIKERHEAKKREKRYQKLLRQQLVKWAKQPRPKHFL